MAEAPLVPSCASGWPQQPGSADRAAVLTSGPSRGIPLPGSRAGRRRLRSPEGRPRRQQGQPGPPALPSRTCLVMSNLGSSTHTGRPQLTISSASRRPHQGRDPARIGRLGKVKATDAASSAAEAKVTSHPLCRPIKDAARTPSARKPEDQRRRVRLIATIRAPENGRSPDGQRSEQIGPPAPCSARLWATGPRRRHSGAHGIPAARPPAPHRAPKITIGSPWLPKLTFGNPAQASELDKQVGAAVRTTAPIGVRWLLVCFPN